MNSHFSCISPLDNETRFLFVKKKIEKVKVVTYFSLFFKTKKQNKKENIV